MAAPPPLGWVRITSDDPPIQITVRLWEERPNVDEGYGGWEAVERPRRSPITTWKSAPGLKMTLPLLIDRWRSGVSVERTIDLIQQMGRPTASDGEPPQIQLNALGGHIPYQGRVWVVDSLSWGEALMNTNGNRVRQQVTLTLLEYVEDLYLTARSAANRRRVKAKQKKRRRGARSKRIVAKRSVKPRRKKKAGTLLAAGPDDDFGQGEDLLTIAARELGDADRWIEIAQLNGLRDPYAISPGQVLRLP